MEDFGLAQWLAGGQGRDLEAGRTRTYDGVALSDSSEGRVTVDLGGDSVTSDEEQGVELPCAPNVKAGDRVSVTVVNGSPTVTGVVGGGDRTAVVIDELSGEVGEVRTIIRQYEDGVLVCKTGNYVGALVNADGSFEVVTVGWTGDTPTAGDVLASFSSSAIRMGNGSVDRFVVDGNGLLLGESGQPQVMLDVMGYLSLMDELGRSRVELLEYDDGTNYSQALTFHAPGYNSVLSLETSGPQYGTGSTKMKSAGNLTLSGGTNGVTLKRDGSVSVDKPAAWRSALGVTPANIGAAANPIADDRLVLKDTSHTVGTTHTGSTEGDASVEFQDSAGTGFGRLTSHVNRNGAYDVTLYATGRNSVGSTIWNALQLGFDATRQTPTVVMSSSAKPAWRSALDLAPVADNDVANVTANSGYTFSEFKSVRFGPHVKIRFVFKATAAMAVDTNYNIGTLASDFRPPFETVLDFRGWNHSATVTVGSNGVISVRPLRQVPANTNIAVTGDIIQTSWGV